MAKAAKLIKLAIFPFSTLRLFVPDIDECAERPGICRDGTCHNLQGSFQCQCRQGFQLNAARDACVDVDECARQPSLCGNGTCVNSLGSYRCHCYPGFKIGPNNDCIGTRTP